MAFLCVGVILRPTLGSQESSKAAPSCRGIGDSSAVHPAGRLAFHASRTGPGRHDSTTLILGGSSAVAQTRSCGHRRRRVGRAHQGTGPAPGPPVWPSGTSWMLKKLWALLGTWYSARIALRRSWLSSSLPGSREGAPARSLPGRRLAGPGDTGPAAVNGCWMTRGSGDKARDYAGAWFVLPHLLDGHGEQGRLPGAPFTPDQQGVAVVRMQ